MKRMILTDNWSMGRLDRKSRVPASIPGSVYTDLLRAGEIEDPFYRDQEMNALALIDNDFIYETRFDADSSILTSEEVFLCFEGIDTLADVLLNGTLLGSPDNMHRIWRYSVRKLLMEKDNLLQVILHSPTNYVRKRNAEDPAIAMSVDAMQGASYLRKAHGMFGWDWGPRLPDAGIWKPVYLEGCTTARILETSIRQEHDTKVKLHFSGSMASLSDGLTYTFGRGKSYGFCPSVKETRLRFTILDPDGCLLGEASLGEGEPEAVFTVEQPQLWWPNGLGKQPLYTIKIDLLKNETVLDTQEKKIGLRTIRLVREKDSYGESFCHEVNGVRIFAMGADYIPMDNLLPRITKERTRKMLADCRDAHFNCIRVWGGGCYADDAFLDACDEFGLLVWQDFCFACATYDLTPEFEESLRAEFIDNILRMRDHASLALWSGNNEMEYFIAGNRDGWCLKPSQYTDYFRMYESMLPNLLRKLDPATPYIPSSPTSGGGMDHPEDENRGDMHYWDVWHGGKPFNEYRKFYFRYLSEFGFQSFPSLATVKSFTLPEDRNLFSYVMEKHQRNRYGNGNLMRYMEQEFLCPGDFPTQVYATQLLQEKAIRTAVEHLRANRGRCMGAIVWQLDDIWPCTSWSMLDYYGRWKAVWYSARRFFAPVIAVCEEESMMTQDPNVNAEPYSVKNAVRFFLCNETLSAQELTLQWEIRTSDGTILTSFTHEETVKPLSSLSMEEMILPNLQPRSQYVSWKLKDRETILQESSVLFCPPKYFDFKDPNLTVRRIAPDLLEVTAEAYASRIEISSADPDLRLSDNYFDMNPGTRQIRVLSGNTDELHAQSVWSIGR